MMVIARNLIIYSLVTTIALSGDPYYCAISSEHLFCRTPDVGPACKDFKQWYFDNNLKRKTIEMHNNWRSKVANGREPRGRNGKQPMAANMMKMEWDVELARIAQRKANQCSIEPDCDDCHAVLGGRFKVGQNLAYMRTPFSNSFEETNVHHILINKMNEWYEDEIHHFTMSALQNYQESGMFENYAQIVLWNARSVGCGASEYSEETTKILLIVCKYGNKLEENIKIYEVGQPCSRCPKETACNQHRLCGK